MFFAFSPLAPFFLFDDDVGFHARRRPGDTGLGMKEKFSLAKRYTVQNKVYGSKRAGNMSRRTAFLSSFNSGLMGKGGKGIITQLFWRCLGKKLFWLGKGGKGGY